MTIAPGDVARDAEVAKLRRLTDVGRALTYTTSLDQVAQLTVDRAAGLLDGSASLLMLPDAEGMLHVRASYGIPEEKVARFRAPLTDDIMARLQGLLGVADDSFIAVPLVAGGAVTGLLAVALTQPGTPADEWMLSALADQTAVALESARIGSEVRHDLEDRLRASEGATHAKERALATLAHDIRSPLGAIDGYCANLGDELYGPLTAEQRKALERVRMSGRHLMSLLDTVLDMARLTAGVIPVEAEPVRCSNVAREAVDILAPAAAARRQELHLGDAASVVVTGNHARLRQVLVNLIGNAVKFTPDEGSIAVAVTAGGPADAQWGEIRVTDSGPGIAANEHVSIFEPYYRSERVATLPGVGLGLAISHELVKQMGGTLTLESTIGQGASFAVRLPLVTAVRGEG